MTATPSPLPPLLFHPDNVRVPPGLEHMRLSETRKAARVWAGPEAAKLPAGRCEEALRRALKDDRAAAHVLDSLGADDRAVLSVYRRHGNTLDGTVLRIDLLERGLVEIARK